MKKQITKFPTFIEPMPYKNVSPFMKSILCFFLLSFSVAAQIYPLNQNPFISLSIYYFPFYDCVQIILEPNYTNFVWYDSLIHCVNDQKEYFIYDLTDYRNNRVVVEISGKYEMIDEHGKIVQAIKFSG